MAARRLTVKLCRLRCLECSTCAMFFNSSLTVSIIVLLRRRTLSETLIMAPFILLLSFVMSCIPLTKSFWKRFLLMYPLPAISLSKICSMKRLSSNGFLSSTSPGVTMKFRSSPFSLHIRCSFNPKNHPIEHLPRAANPLKSLMDMNSLIATDTQRCGIHKTDACTLAEENFLDKDDERNDHFLLKFNKAVIGYQSGKQVSKMYTDIIVVEMFKAAVARVVKKNHDNHDLRIGHGRLAMIFENIAPMVPS